MRKSSKVAILAACLIVAVAYVLAGIRYGWEYTAIVMLIALTGAASLGVLYLVARVAVDELRNRRARPRAARAPYAPPGISSGGQPVASSRGDIKVIDKPAVRFTKMAKPIVPGKDYSYAPIENFQAARGQRVGIRLEIQSLANIPLPTDILTVKDRLPRGARIDWATFVLNVGDDKTWSADQTIPPLTAGDIFRREGANMYLLGTPDHLEGGKSVYVRYEYDIPL